MQYYCKSLRINENSIEIPHRKKLGGEGNDSRGGDSPGKISAGNLAGRTHWGGPR